MLSEQVEELDERVANLYDDADPDGIIASAPGVGPVTRAIIAGRIGDPHRFHSLAAIRAYSGLVPKLSESGQTSHQHGLTKTGDALLREAMWAAADQARKTDPQLAAKYARLMNTDRHHDSALCHIATIVLTRIATCWRNREHYSLRDTDGRPITEAEGRHSVREHHQVDRNIRQQAADRRRAQKLKGRTDREQKKSQSASASRPANSHDNHPIVA